MSPRVEFKAENKVATTNYDYPKLKLKSGERARIVVGLESPIVEYVHTLRKPQIVNGVPVTFEAERKDGSKYIDHKMDFISRPICLGDQTILDDKGSDPKNCPMCKLAQDYPDYGQAPKRRYAMHIVRYRTKGGTTEVATPFSVEVLVWSFTDTVFNKIVDFKEEWGDLRKHDLLLGPCTNEMFQQFDITVAAKAAWLEDEQRQKLTAETFKENQIPDLTIAAGSVKQKQWIEQDVQTILEAWGDVRGAEEQFPETATDLGADLSNLLDKAPAASPAAAPAADTADSPDAFAGLGVETPKEEGSDDTDVLASIGTVEEAAPAAEPEVAPAAAAPGAESFDDLLADLK